MDYKKRVSPAAIFIIMLILQVGVIIFWGNIKEGYFIDELYSMEGAHNITRLSLSQKGYKWQTQDDFFERWHDSDEFIEHITVSEDDSLFNLPVQKFIDKLIKRQYYSLINIVSGINPNIFSKWHGIGLNILIFVLVQCILYRLTYLSSKSKYVSLAVTAIYGFSAGAISTTIFIRTYMLSTLWVMLIIYMHYWLMKQKQIFKEIAGIVIILVLTYMGYKSHQYVLVFSASLFISYMFYLIISKLWRKSCLYAIFFMTAGISYVSLKGLSSMLSGEQGEAAVSNLLGKPIIDFIKDVCSYVATLINHLFGNKYLVALVFFICICGLAARLLVKKSCIPEKSVIREVLKEEAFNFVVLGTIIIYIIVIGRICPWVNWRYIATIYPLTILSMYCIVKNILSRLLGQTKMILVIGIFYVICIAFSYNTKSISELHLGAEKESKILAADYAKTDNIFVFDGDEGRLYLNSYIYPKDTRVFITEKSYITQQDIYFSEKAPDSVLMWVSAVNENFENTVKDFINNSSYEKAELLLDRSRHNECYYVYLLQK